MEIIRSKVQAFLNFFTEGLSLLMSSVGANQMMIKMKWYGWGRKRRTGRMVVEMSGWVVLLVVEMSGWASRWPR